MNWPGVLKTRAVPIQILKLGRYSKALSGPANNWNIARANDKLTGQPPDSASITTS
jgi:hypothetical protein